MTTCPETCPLNHLLDAGAELAGVQSGSGTEIKCTGIKDSLENQLALARRGIKITSEEDITEALTPEEAARRRNCRITGLNTLAFKELILKHWKEIIAANSPSQLQRPEEISNELAINYAQNFLDSLKRLTGANCRQRG